KTGYTILCQEACDLLKRAGARVKGNTVKTPQHLVEECIRLAPKGFVLYDRDGNRALEVEGRKTYFGTSTASPNTRDALTAEIHPTRVEDIARGALIADALTNIDWVMPMGSSQDVPAQAAELYEFEAVVTHTRKPIVFIAYSPGGHEMVYEMAAQVAGGMDLLREHPFLVAYPEPITPLVYPEEVAEKLLFTAGLHMPVIAAPAGQAGATNPVTLAGTLVVMNAETLMGLVLSQLKNPGTPFVLGGVPSITDMATGNLSMGAPEFSLMTAAYADVARFYGLPCWGTAGCSDAKTPDQEAAAESAFSCLAQALGGVNLIHDVGYLDTGMICSAEMLVMGDEVIGMVRRLLQGIEVNSETVAREVIEKVGPGGNFLQEDHTYRHFRNEHWVPTLMTRQRYDVWHKEGGKSMGERVREKIRHILETHTPPPLADSTLKELDRLKREGERKLAREASGA
ncbi:MAG: trimethylamine methyltransferase family protein, partial [Deltaproteobacteria bacterium]|nr:trimethylamine methyltransferase family protein [Deltaproteobacteria bacterium]